VNIIKKYRSMDFKIKLLGFLLLSGLLAYLAESTIFAYLHFSIDRIVLLTMAFMFVSLHLIFNLNKMYDFMFHKRYLIAAVLFIFIVVNGYHGSSISRYNNYIQPNLYVSDSQPIFGVTRSVRSDEWLISTPLTLSQASETVNFANDNPLLMARDSNVNMFPQLPTRNISILSNLFMTGFLFLNTEMGFSFYWFGKLFVMFLGSFELCMLLTKKNKLYALMGAIMITFAPATQWWYPLSILMYGQIAIVVLDNFLKSTKWQMKLFYSFLMALSGSGYIMCVYPAWQVPFGYMFLGLVVWVFIDNKYKFDYHDLGFLFLCILMIVGIIAPALINSLDVVNATLSTIYPGKRFITGGYGWSQLFDYFNTIYLPFRDSPNSSEFSQYIGLFPIPLLMAGWLSIKNFKNKKHDPLMIILIATAIFLGFWNVFELPSFIAKITLMYMSFPERSNIVIGLICIYLMVHIMAVYQQDDKTTLTKKAISVICTVVIVIAGLLYSYDILPGYLSLKMALLSGIVLGFPMMILLQNNRKLNKFISVYLILLLLGVGATVNPVSKGLSVIYEKPFAKEVQKIVKADPDGRWIVVGVEMLIQDYMVANGAKVINSVNFYPNIELWDKIDTEKKYADVYNRYARVSIELTKTPTTFSLPHPDVFVINLNNNDICVLKVDYIAVKDEMTNFITDKMNLVQTYNEDGIRIYKVICN